MSEIWKPVVGFEGLYEVSDQGRVRSLDRADAIGRSIRGRILRPAFAGKGYLHVILSRGGVATSPYVHRLVAAAFIGPCPDGQEVRHLDGVKTNCAAGNLRYGTSAENNADKKGHGTHFVGEGHHNALLTDDAVRVIRSTPVRWGTLSVLGRQFGVSAATVKGVVSGKTWRHV